MMDEQPAVLDLFAGCGGLSKGLEKAGFRIVAANEFWEVAQRTYVRNHPSTKFFLGDITDPKTKKAIVDFFKDKRCDVIAGGPPCQAYSMAGSRDPDDPRGKLFEDYVGIVGNLHPTVFVMENVKGILTMKHERGDLTEEERKKLLRFKKLQKERAKLMLLRKQYKNNPDRFKFTEADKRKLEQVKDEIKIYKDKVSSFYDRVTDKIVEGFSKIGYNVEFKLLNSADYGVPQKRERVVFIGTRHNIPIIFPTPTHAKYATTTLNGRKLKPWVTVREAIDDLKDKQENVKLGHIFTSHSEKFRNKIRNTPIGKSVFGGYTDAFFRNPPEEPSRTVKENHGGVLVHYAEDRVMTPRELARLQSFPDDFIFEGSKSVVLKQIGDAVPPRFGEAIGRSIKEMLKLIEYKESGKKS